MVNAARLVSVTLCGSLLAIAGLMTVPANVAADDGAFRIAMAKAVRTAAQRVLPAVVTVEIIGTSGTVRGEVEQDAPTSGVVVDSSGFILASSIVVRRESASILVVLPDGSRHAANVVSRDHHRDLVLLKIKTDKPLQAIDLDADFDTSIGQTTIAVGRYGSDVSPLISRGVLSARGRLDGIAIQTDARVSPAFYGGPLIDLYGNVLGILIPAVAEGGAEDATSWYDSGIAFAIPTKVIARKLDRLKKGQDVKKGLIGIVAKSKDPYENVTEIAAVRTRSPAEAAGMKAGDKILSVDGHLVRRHQEIRQVLGSFDAGEQIQLKVLRGKEELEIEITLAESIPPLKPQRLGVIVREQSRSDEESGEDQEGETPVASSLTVDAIVPGSPADGELQSGDEILAIGEAAIKDAESLRRQMISAEPDQPLVVSVRRDAKALKLKITPGSVSGPVLAGVPDAWKKKEEPDTAWKIQEIKLPDSGNSAAYVAPESADEISVDQLGMLMLLLSPGQGSPEEVLESWLNPATQAGVVVCAIAPENSERWRPKEIEMIGKFAAALLKKAPIDKAAVAVAASGALAGGDAEAADSMVMAVAISQSSTFFGAAISPKTRPPAVRVRENEPSASLQLLMPVESDDDLPAWTATIKKAGYPVVLGGKTDRITLLRWARLLQAI